MASTGTAPVDFEGAVAQFHHAFGVSDRITDPKTLRALLERRVTLIREEFEEVLEAVEAAQEKVGAKDFPVEQFEHLAKEMADLLYVVFGSADLLGIPLSKAFARVHDSNMSKLGEDGRPVLREDGKVLKGPNYRPANMGEVGVDILVNYLSQKF
ncbi:MazG nucleotide pyrophosphohydrolase domain-containing protein [Streptomyces sp. RTd22]|uniref:MazG nucleotide pyrophosphohydrolase domain-containing protein n=1 Tax=Streptomyces sp. RTd22 TaxID=1841249 RepID=UPI0007C4F77D|nr:MazG nucleotide pyrophosphohydrolase domain-containing protein [Streptomyces sp. RTd22]